MATTDKRLTITELDFDDIKTNLKTFMRNQTEFTDYDFEGSANTFAGGSTFVINNLHRRNLCQLLEV